MHPSHIQGLFCVIGAERWGKSKIKGMLWLITMQESTLRVTTYQLVLPLELVYNVVLTRGALAPREL